MKKINWMVRIQNKAFWLSLIPAVLLLIQVVAAVFGYQLELGELGNRLLAVVNALYFRTTWMNEFDPQRTSPQEFTRADGSAVTADFMHADGQWTSAWLGENYTIASMGLSSKGVAFFVLPEEGTSAQELLEDPDFWEGLGQFLDGGAYTKVNWSVPKFTVDSQYQLEAMLPQLGFDTACDPEAANFSGIPEVRATVEKPVLPVVRETGELVNIS